MARITSAQKCPEGSAVTVAYGDDRAQLAGSPWFVASAARKDFDYAFLHVPKTAGTSLRKALESALGAPQIFPSQAYLKARDGDYSGARFMNEPMYVYQFAENEMRRRVDDEGVWERETASSSSQLIRSRGFVSK